MKAILFAIVLAGYSTLPLADTSKPPQFDRISLSASASENIANDILVATLFAQQEGDKPATLSEKINKAIKWAIAIAKKHPEIEVRTQAYSTQPVYNKNRVVGWRVKQSIELKSKNIPLLSKLIGELQEQLSVQSMAYQVSDDLRQTAEDRLIAQAIHAFEQRAQLVKTTMRRSGYQLVDMDINTANGPAPRPYIRSSALTTNAVAKSAPTIVAGSKKLTVNIRGTVQLSRD